MREELRAGVAVYNAGEFHAAHDAWEPRWLDLESGTDDELLLHGLIQYTAAVHHATRGNWAGAAGLAKSGADYLGGLPDEYRGVGVERARAYLDRLAADPEVIERAQPWPLVHDGDVVQPVDLAPTELELAAATVAEDHGYDEGTIERAADRLGEEYAAERSEREADRLRTLLEDFVGAGEGRGVVLQRLSERLERIESREGDVEGLFE